MSNVTPLQKHPNWGGARPKSGRRRGGSLGQLQYDCLSYRKKYGVMPVDHMLKILNEPLPDIPDLSETATKEEKEKRNDLLRERRQLQRRQDWAAVNAAPYMHQKLAQVEVIQQDDHEHPEVDLSKLAPEELDALEALVIKASEVPPEDLELTLDEDQYHEVKE
jgi:hypothetical protein